MTRGKGNRAPRWKWIAPVLALGVVLAAVHVWLNTNLVTGDAVCGGLVSTARADSVLSGGGRISDGDGPDVRPGDAVEFSCTVEASSFLPGADKGRLRISGTHERGDFAFTDGRWPSPATASFFSGPATGGVGRDHGWVLLPAGCAKAAPAIIEGYAPQGSDPTALAGLLTDVANRAAERAGCAPDRPLTAPGTLPAVPAAQKIPEDAVCGIKGLAFPGPAAGREAARQRVQGRTGPTWACEVSGHATYAVTREPRVLEAITTSPGFGEQPRIAGLRVSGFDERHVVADCSGTPTYFSMELGPTYTAALESPDTPSPKAVFADFVTTAGKNFGCSTTAP
ncbi:hypothetical protein OG413_00750 [Streptomyces sp. NBC_01433]|uniref:hypothetical protein n=1 Tax=Streptomyces sp. NBC_01433 TaxID=2903864 RepID=UPI00225A8220|nr:hypothetical protein [Streptomyces sp. NBC_01433]MCX4673864.1 hypothetical protein [Streptomyces sp. NBC_01433]